jgi:hypothetical protein
VGSQAWCWIGSNPAESHGCVCGCHLLSSPDPQLSPFLSAIPGSGILASACSAYVLGAPFSLSLSLSSLLLTCCTLNLSRPRLLALILVKHLRNIKRLICLAGRRRPGVAGPSSRLTLLWNVLHHYGPLHLVPNENKFWSKPVKMGYFAFCLLPYHYFIVLLNPPSWVFLK